MSRVLVFFTVFFGFKGIHSHGNQVINFNLNVNETVIKEITVDLSSSSHFLMLQTSSPVTLKVSGGSVDCPKVTLLEDSDSVDIEIPTDTWQTVAECWKRGNEGKIMFYVENPGEAAEGNLTLYSAARRPPITVVASDQEQDPNRFTVSVKTPFWRKIKLESLTDEVEIRLTSENAENALEVYISFCPTIRGILYTTSYAPNVDITLKSPRMELYYDAYSCDSNITFYSNTTQPVSPLIIRLDSRYPTNGTISVLVNGAPPSIDSHVAEYETGTFTVEGGAMKTFELKYQPNMENVRAFLDVVSGSIPIWISQCKNIPLDVFYTNLAIGSHRIDVNIEDLMENTTCSLMEIDPTTVFLTVKPPITSTFTLWLPGDKATWHLAIAIGGILILLAIAMALIIFFGRRKTGKLIINYFY